MTIGKGHGGLKPVYYIFGEEDFLVEEALNDIRLTALSGGFESMNYHAFDAPTLEPEEVVSTARTFPAFSHTRLVVVKGADTLKSGREEMFIEYLNDPSPSTCLVFIAFTGKGVKGSKLYKRVAKSGVVKPCYRLREGELAAWVTKEAGRQGKKMSGEAVARLLAIAGGALREVKGELDKIIIYAGSKDVVDAGDVERAGCVVRDETAFGLADAIGRKDTRTALRVLKKISGEEPLKVLGAVTWQFRNLLKVKGLLNKGVRQSQLSQEAGVPFRNVKGYVESCSRFSEGELIGAFEKFKSADRDLKSSRLPGRLIMSRLVIELCS